MLLVLGNMLPRQLRIAFRHFYIRVAQDLCQLVKVATVHHVPRCKRVTQMPIRVQTGDVQ